MDEVFAPVLHVQFVTPDAVNVALEPLQTEAEFTVMVGDGKTETVAVVEAEQLAIVPLAV